MKEKFSIVRSTCLPIDIDNCNTDLIIPARYLASTTRDPQFYGDAFMCDVRRAPSFVLNRPPFDERPSEGMRQIIVGGNNWGSGSSREHAAWAIAGYGVRVVIASSIADIHRNNLLNCFVLPVVVPESFRRQLIKSITDNPQTVVEVDVPRQTVTDTSTGAGIAFDLNPYKKLCLLNGYDDIDYLLSNLPAIEAWEACHA